MRITHLADVPVVMHIRRHGETIVALPVGVSKQDILGMASLVLSSEEFEELSHKLPSDDLL